MYGRYGNPSRNGVEAVIAAMEGAQHTLIFSSGMASINAVVETLKTGDQIVACSQMYGGAYKLLRDCVSDFGIEATFVEDISISSVVSALTSKTKLVWLEACTNPTIVLLDVAALAKAIKNFSKDIIFGVDNTFLSPYILRPLEMGADLVMHSCTKFMGGHSDLILGALSTNNESLGLSLRKVQKYRGATPSSFDCYLLHRSLMTLEVRMEKHHSNALEIAKYLEGHPCIDKVLHPLLKSNQSREVAESQNKGMHSGVFSFYMRGSATRTFMSSLKLIYLAVSLGGLHTTISVPVYLSHAFLTEAERQSTGITENLVRISVGLENPQDLMNDLDQALKKATSVAK